MSSKNTAKETLLILDKGGFTSPSGTWVELKNELKNAVDNTLLYTPDQLTNLLKRSLGKGKSCIKFEVSSETTQASAHRLVVKEGVSDLVLLNFASARNVGGGFLNGAKAQEEDLARCSGLYPCLLTQPQYYEANRRQSSLLYTDHIIYSPKVPWFRINSHDAPDQLFLASVITAPAPNAGQFLRQKQGNPSDLGKCLKRRCGMILAVANENNHRNLLLGAWGCGAFSNNPDMVADAFAYWLESDFSDAFDRVVFAVYENSGYGSKLKTFRNRFLVKQLE